MADIEAPKDARELFVQRSQSNIVAAGEVAVLPLGVFSEFVLRKQPELLSQVVKGELDPRSLVQRQEELISKITDEEIGQVVADPGLARIGMLDLSFAMSGVIFSGVTPAVEVSQLNQRLAVATGLPETMTFEKIVRVNSALPFDQMRTFTDGDSRNTERHFYYGHQLMDDLLQGTVRVTSSAVDILGGDSEVNIKGLVDLLVVGRNNITNLADYMRKFHKMSGSDFTVFRQYLSQYPDGTRNASGAFIGMPRLQLRLVGLTPTYEQFLDAGMKYFPIDEQSDIEQARLLANDGQYLVAQCERMDSGKQRSKIAQVVKSIIEQLRDFRISHLVAVNKYVPEALPEGLSDLKLRLLQAEEEPIFDDSSTVAKGTAGFIPGPLLRNVLRMDMRGIERLEKLI